MGATFLLRPAPRFCSALYNATADSTDANGLYDAGSDLVLAEYFYDGLGRRIAKAVAVYSDNEDPAAVTGWQRTDYYYNESWQVLEERSAAVSSATMVVTYATAGLSLTQYVWDAMYVDTPIVRDVDTGGDGHCTGSGDQHLYYLTDANHNVTALLDAATGFIVERYAYSPYGALTIFDGQTALDGTATVDWSPRTGPAAVSLAGNTLLYTGLSLDIESSLYAADHRYYSSSLGIWISRDPKGYVDGQDLYSYAKGSPIDKTDPTGEASIHNGWNVGDHVVVSPWGFFNDYGAGKLELINNVWHVRLWSGEVVSYAELDACDLPPFSATIQERVFTLGVCCGG